jgi:hypothetical protein
MQLIREYLNSLRIIGNLLTSPHSGQSLLKDDLTSAYNKDSFGPEVVARVGLRKDGHT